MNCPKCNADMLTCMACGPIAANQVPPSNTNTAARELPSNDHLRLRLGETTAQEMRTAKAAYRLALTETLTQQQGGEQEAGDCGDEALQRAYWLGWRNSAAWADRKDLWADRDSPAYTQERDDALGTLAAAVKLGKE